MVEGAGRGGMGWRFGGRVWSGGQIQMEVDMHVVRDWSREDIHGKVLDMCA